MEAIAWSKFRRKPEETADLARTEPVALTFARGEDLILMSRREWSSLVETLYVLSDPRDAADLRQALEDVKAGRTVTVDPDAL